MAKVISVMNPKGGVGKSTVVRLLCGYFLDKGVKFKIVDMGSQLTCFNLIKREENERLAGLIIPLVTDNESTFTNTLDLLKDEELIIIDSNANITKEEINMVAAMSDIVVVPVIASLGDIDATLRFSRFMRVAKELGVVVRTLINKFDDTLENREVRRICTEDFKLIPFKTCFRNKPAAYRRYTFNQEPDKDVRLLGQEIDNILNTIKDEQKG